MTTLRETLAKGWPEMTPERASLLLALAQADGQAWQSITEATPHTAEIMYGDQADAVLAWVGARLAREGVLGVVAEAAWRAAASFGEASDEGPRAYVFDYQAEWVIAALRDALGVPGAPAGGEVGLGPLPTLTAEQAASLDVEALPIYKPTSTRAMSEESGVAAYADEARDWAALTAASAAEAMCSPEYATAEYVDDVTTIVRGLEKRSRDHIGHIGALRLRIETLERLNIAASKQRVMLGAATIVQAVAIIVLAVTR